MAGFCYFAGEVNRELIGHKPAGCEFDNVLMVPPTKAWEEAIQEVYQEKAKPWTRYATNRDKTAFDRSKLAELAAGLPQGYELRPIDEEIYNLTLTLPWAWDLCGNIPGYSRFAANALGFVIFHGGELVSGASSYAFFQGNRSGDRYQGRLPSSGLGHHLRGGLDLWRVWSGVVPQLGCPHQNLWPWLRS